MIQVRDITRCYGDTTVVDNVSFDVARGELLVLLGRSGCGKTTTLKMINRLIEPTSGDIVIDGRSISSVDPIELRRGIGYVIQENGLFPHYTVAENVGLVPHLLKHDPEQIRSNIPRMLERVGLDPERFLNVYPSRLSGGEQQRVAIARAIAAEPPLLLMDEPFSALDPITRSDVRSTFRDLARTLDTTVILVTHDLSEAVELADRIALMDRGRIVRVGTTAEMLFGEHDQFIDSFFRRSRFEAEMQVVDVGMLYRRLQKRGEGEYDQQINQLSEADNGPLPVSPDRSLYSLVQEFGNDLNRSIAVDVTMGSGEKGITNCGLLLEEFIRFKRDGGNGGKGVRLHNGEEKG